MMILSYLHFLSLETFINPIMIVFRLPSYSAFLLLMDQNALDI